MAQLKIGNVVIEHSISFTGEVSITKGDASITLPIDALVRLVAEKVRAERIAALEKAKPHDLINKLA